MKKETPMHSAEFCRGAIDALESLAGVVLFIQIPEIKEALASWIDKSSAFYRQQLAEAEAREAGERSAEVVSTVRSELLKCLDNAKTLPQDARQAGVVAGWESAVELLDALCEADQPSLADELAAAQAEVERLSARVDALEESMNPQDVQTVDAGIAAREARLKALGAAEWLEAAAREGGYYERSSEGMLEEAAQLRQQAEAARLAEGE